MKSVSQKQPRLNQELLRLCQNPNTIPVDIEAILKAGADIEARDNKSGKNTPLILAVENRATSEVIEVLLKAGANVEAKNEYGRTPLMWAAWDNENHKVIESLLKAGVDIEARDESGETPLIWAAAKNNNHDVIDALLKAGANTKAKDKEGKTALDYVKDNKKIYKTKVYWKLNQLQYE